MHEAASQTYTTAEDEQAALQAALDGLAPLALRLPTATVAGQIVDGAMVALDDALGDATDRPVIPPERARGLLEAACAAGLVNDDDSFTVALRRALDAVGVRSLAQLAPDEADHVDALVAEFAA
jgi:hypothetical protein